VKASTSDVVRLLEEDPDLAGLMSGSRRAEAERELVVRVHRLGVGVWDVSRLEGAGSDHVGLLLLEGVVAREVIVADHVSAELLGPGDLLRAGDDNEGEELLPRTIEWAAATSARIAIVDQALAVRMAQWPEIFAALMDRAARRAERLVVTQAIAHLTRVDDRLLALLWLLAERWGRVVPGGVLVSLRLPHRTLAGMVGARRPSVTTALGQLMARGAIERRSDGAWILRGTPPSEERIETAAAVPFVQQRVGAPVA
jgi:CRP-like cAMP-binding protein